MLKRARCTIYLVQESDTLGKDSELASTLAQGKAVIGYVPAADEHFVDRLLDQMRLSEDVSDQILLLQLLRLFKADAAWSDPIVQRWLSDPSRLDAETNALKAMVQAAIKEHYDRRAAMLRDQHPFGIQVNLATGVANGVLVLRTEEACAEVVRRIVTSTLEFDVEEA